MKYFILFVMTITGACVLILEIIATRILAPYFGNTLYTISAVLTTILAALSIGYYLGGRLADAYPSKKIFYFIISFSGISVLLIQLLNTFVLPRIGYTVPAIEGALFASLILFFFPTLLLGTLSPFAIKLTSIQNSMKGIGNTAGTIFFWSTFGSIFGSLSSGFFLIPRFGINAIIISIGIILVLLGISGLMAVKAKLKYYTALIVILLIELFILAIFNHGKKSILFQKDGVYEKIIIFEDFYLGKPTRFILQDKNFSGAMYLGSTDLVYDYTQYFELYKFVNPHIKDALVLGGSASYSIPKALLSENANISVDTVDIEPSFPLLGKQYFNVAETPRLQTYIKDGRRYLYDTDKSYDLIYSDVYLNLNSVPVHFTTKEFFTLTKQRLNPDGVLIVNFIGSLSQKPPSLLLSEMKTLRSVFPNSYLFAVGSPQFPSLQNFILVGVNNDENINFAKDLKEVKNDSFLKTVHEHLVDLQTLSLDEHLIFTDDFAPVEYLTARN